MFKIEIDLVNQCGECNDFHYTVYKWTGNAWVNILCGICNSPDECFKEGYSKFKDFEHEKESN